MLWARWAIAAVVTSPPQVSSIVIAMPSETQRSRAWRARVRPPNLLILRLTTSMAWSAAAAQHRDSERRRSTSSSDERMIGVPANGQALLVAQAGLLDVHVDVADGAAPPAIASCWHPTGVGVGDEHVVPVGLRRPARMRSMSTSGSPPTLSWNAGILRRGTARSCCAISSGVSARCRCGERTRRHISRRSGSRPAAPLAEEIPAGDVDGGLA